MDNRGINQDPGWINRKFQDISRQIEALRSERRFRNLPTTSATANMVVDATTGDVSRSTSSARYKQDIADVDLDLAAILKMRPRVWRDKRDVAAKGVGAARYVGFVAEELDDAGLGMFVGYDTEGKPESVNYDRLTVALLIGCKVLAGRIAALTSRATVLESDVEGLRTAGATLAVRTNSLATRATALESESAEQATRVSTLETTVADLTARLSVLETAAAPTPPLTQ